MQSRSKSIFNIFTLFALLASLLGSTVTVTSARAATLQFDIAGPAGSGQFGYTVTTLPNGNFVVADPFYDAPGPIANVGAVYLYNGATHALISTLTGSTASDQVGSSGITALTNGNYVVNSPYWDGFKGAATWGGGTTGVSGAVSAANSLVGSAANDLVGSYYGVTALTNGNYVVNSPNWAGNKGAATWGSGTAGIAGAVSAANSLVGLVANDQVGYFSATALTNGNYVVSSPKWDGYKGAATWGNGTTGIAGTVSVANSLVGSAANDQVGHSITALTNGNYVVRSPYWDGYKGAATWGGGTGGTVGAVSTANSLVGSAANDQVGYYGITALTNGNYVVSSPFWDGYKGAATWGGGTGGTVGAVSTANSLAGSAANDQVGYRITELTNGNYVVSGPYWDGNKGAATWSSGTTGITGTVSAANSLVGSAANDLVGTGGITALTNGNYVVSSPDWDSAKGAATWGSGTTGITGAVSTANSLVGSATNDLVGYNGVTALTNGNYVVSSLFWDGNKGAATWGDGTSGISGAVSAANSLVGSAAVDQVGSGSTALTNGNYVVSSPFWDGNKGAATWGNGTTGVTGAVSTANSLVGSAANDRVGNYGITALTNGNYVVSSPFWDGTALDSGAVTLGTGVFTAGSITAVNSVLGTAASGGISMNFNYDYFNDQLVVGRPADNIVTLFKYTPPTVTMSSAASNPTNTMPIAVTVTFNETVTGFTSGDITASNGTVSGFAGSGATYTFNLTPSGQGLVTADIGAGVAFDSTGNGNTAATQFNRTYSVTYNLFLPLILR